MNLRKSITITFGSQYIDLVMTFFSSLILARLLTPEDLSTYSIAASVALIGHLFRSLAPASTFPSTANIFVSRRPSHRRSPRRNW